jgi:hypothetical protein
MEGIAFKENAPLFIIEDSKACSRWKALKAETRLVEEEIEVLIDGLLTREEQIVSKRLRLVHLVKELTEKVNMLLS